MIKNIEDKIRDITNLATNASINAKINEVKGEMRTFTNLATNVSLQAKINKIKNKIPNITNLATTTDLTSLLMSAIQSKKTDESTKISGIKNKTTGDLDHDKFITTQEFNKLTSENVDARFKKTNLASKNDTANFVKKIDFDNKLKDVTSNKNELNKLSRKVKAILAKVLTKDLIVGYS